MPQRPISNFSLAVPLLVTMIGSADGSFHAPAFHATTPTTGRMARRHAPRQTHLFQSKLEHSPLEDSPWENDPSYFDRLREAAKDPATFEQFVMSSKRDGENGAAKSPEAPRAKAKTRKGGYQRIEDWEEELRDKQDGSGMTWEEKVQFEGLRNGNQVKQNDILMHHLHTF